MLCIEWIVKIDIVHSAQLDFEQQRIGANPYLMYIHDWFVADYHHLNPT